MRAARAALLATALALAALTGVACDGGSSADDAVAGDLVGRFQEREPYVPLAEALALTGIDGEIENGTFTVLAPTETALRYIGSDFRPVLFAEAQRETLRRVLRHHILPGRLTPDAFADGAALTAIDGTTLRVRRIGPVVTVNGVTVDVNNPVEASNGVAYPAADVLLDVLPTAERVRLSPQLSTLARGLAATGVLAEAEALGQVTILAPLNAAFASGSGAALVSAANLDVYRRVQRALVLPGAVDLDALAGQTVATLAGDLLAVTRDADRALFVGGVRVLHAETTADGRVYVLGGPVLTTLSVGERIRIEPDVGFFALDLLRAPASAALLADRGRAVTVFAPTNTAYLNRSAALNEILREPPQEALVRRLVAGHIVPGRYAPADLTDGLRLTTTDGTVLAVARIGDVVTINGFPLEIAPLVQTNGIMYPSERFFLPLVDLFDTLLLDGYVGFARAVRRAGAEADYRSTVRTAFVLPDSLATPAFQNRPDLPAILRWTSTTDFVPPFVAEGLPYRFTSRRGTVREIVDSGCTPSRTNPCSAFALGDTGVQVYAGRTTGDGTAALHRLRRIDLPPAGRDAPPPPRR